MSQPTEDPAPRLTKLKKKIGRITIDTPPATVTPGAPVVTDGGSLRGDGISVGVAGLRVNDPSRSLSSSNSFTVPPAKQQSNGADGDRLALSEFTVVRDLGEGTSGVVRLVRHKPTQRKYAMKVIQLGCSEQERKRNCA